MENPYRLPAALAEEMGRRLAAVAINRYPDPTGTALKQRLREAMAIPAGSLEIVLGNGSDEILQLVTVALAKPGATVLSLELPRSRSTSSLRLPRECATCRRRAER